MTKRHLVMQHAFGFVSPLPIVLAIHLIGKVVSLLSRASIANLPDSFSSWKDAGDDLAPVPSVNAKVLLVSGPDQAGVGQLAHANQARIG